jgi:hypothetical protein
LSVPPVLTNDRCAAAIADGACRTTRLAANALNAAVTRAGARVAFLFMGSSLSAR